MAFTVLFDFRRRVLFVRFGAALTQPAMTAMNQAIERFVAREGACPGILDLSVVETVSLPSAFVASLAQRKGVLIDQRRAIVAPSDELFGLGRMFGAFNDPAGQHVVVVRILAEAYAALGVSDLDLHPVD